MSSFFDFGVFNYVPSDKSSIMHLKFNEAPAKSAPPDHELRGVTEVHLSTAVKDIETISENIKIAGDPMADVAEHVIDKAFDRLLEISAENGKLVNDRFPTGINLKLDGNAHRKIFARILAVSNMIAVMGRRGPANFALVSESTYKRLFFPDGETKNKFYQPDPNAGGLKFFISPVGNRVIVGRKGSMEENGIFIKCDTPEVEDYKIDESHDIESVDVKYSITEIGDFLPYISFDIVE
jgi:hypothetical protein